MNLLGIDVAAGSVCGHLVSLATVLQVVGGALLVFVPLGRAIREAGNEEPAVL